MNLSEINPYIRYAARCVITAPYHINQRIILDYELIYVDNGEFVLTYNGEDFLCPKGSILLICPNIPHSFHILDVDLSQPHIHFDIKYDSQSKKVYICYQDYPKLSPSERLLIRENVFPHLEDSPFIKINDKDNFLKTFFDIIDSKDSYSLTSKAQMLYLIQEIIADNAPEFSKRPSSDTKITTLIKSYIDSNYEQEMTLDTLERQFDYSKYYIEKLFKQKYGVSVINYRNTKRMEAAVRLLEEHSVSRVAEILGFSSIYSFSRAFRMTYGVSPTKYMQDLSKSILSD